MEHKYCSYFIWLVPLPHLSIWTDMAVPVVLLEQAQVFMLLWCHAPSSTFFQRSVLPAVFRTICDVSFQLTIEASTYKIDNIFLFLDLTDTTTCCQTKYTQGSSFVHYICSWFQHEHHSIWSCICRLSSWTYILGFFYWLLRVKCNQAAWFVGFPICCVFRWCIIVQGE